MYISSRCIPHPNLGALQVTVPATRHEGIVTGEWGQPAKPGTVTAPKPSINWGDFWGGVSGAISAYSQKRLSDYQNYKLPALQMKLQAQQGMAPSYTPIDPSTGQPYPMPAPQYATSINWPMILLLGGSALATVMLMKRGSK